MNHLLTSLLLACFTLAPGLNSAENELSDATSRPSCGRALRTRTRASGSSSASWTSTAAWINQLWDHEERSPEPVDGDTLFEIGGSRRSSRERCWRTWLNASEVSSTIPFPNTCPRLSSFLRTMAAPSPWPNSPRIPPAAALAGQRVPPELQDPLADYTAGQMYEFLSRYQPPPERKTRLVHRKRNRQSRFLRRQIEATTRYPTPCHGYINQATTHPCRAITPVELPTTPAGANATDGGVIAG